MEIERRFLLETVPPELMSQEGNRIQQGYIVSEDEREVRLRCTEKAQVLTVKEGMGIARGEVEVLLTRAQFDDLWPLTEGRRLAKVRRTFRWEGHLVEVDNFEPPHSPLVIAEIEFDDLATAHAFTPPKGFGREITDDIEYRNSWMATHGLPGPRSSNMQSGTVPLIERDGELHMVIVTNSSQTAWIVPKGNVDDGMSRHDAAMMEAAEEGGVLGQVVPSVKATCHLSSGRHLVLFLQKVTSLLSRWPESTIRKRRIVPIATGLKLISDPALRTCVKRIVDRAKKPD